MNKIKYNLGTIINKDIILTLDDKFRHQCILSNDIDKSKKIMSNEIINNINNGIGNLVIDTYGDLTDSILKNIDKNSKNNVIVISPVDIISGNLDNGLNLLKNIKTERDLFVFSDLFIDTINKIYEDEKGPTGPHLEDYLRNSLELLFAMRNEIDFSLKNVNIFIDDIDLIQKGLSNYSNEISKDCQGYWEKHLENVKVATNDFNEILLYIKSKLEIFSKNLFLSKIIENKESNIDFGDIMNEGKTILLKLNRSVIGSDNIQIIGLLSLMMINLNLNKRMNVDSSNRKPFLIYIDQIHLFMTNSLMNLFSEGRKYKIGIIGSNQFLNKKELNNLLGNIGTFIIFKCSENESKELNKLHNINNIDFSKLNDDEFYVSSHSKNGIQEGIIRI